MKLDEAIEKAILRSCKNEGVEFSANAIIKFVERYNSNEIRESDIPQALQNIYETMKG